MNNYSDAIRKAKADRTKGIANVEQQWMPTTTAISTTAKIGSNARQGR
jgi:hypothetical protein